MSEPVVLSFEKHGKLRLSDFGDFTQFKSQHLLPVIFQEFYALATEFPLVFVRNSANGDFVPAALMGLSEGNNLFCQTPEWDCAFIPTSFSLAPLTAHRLKPDSDEAVIAVDEESNLLSETVGEPLFQANGEYTDYLQKRVENLVTITKQSLHAMALCRLLAEKKLLRSRPIALQYTATSRRYELEGVFTIDEEALEKCSDEEYLELRRRGLMPLIYSHLTSLHQFGRLQRLQHQADLKQAEVASA